MSAERICSGIEKETCHLLNDKERRLIAASKIVVNADETPKGEVCPDFPDATVTYSAPIGRLNAVLEMNDYVPAETGGVISLYPGIRQLMTGFHISGRIYTIGEQEVAKVHTLCHRYDEIAQSIPHVTADHHLKLRQKRSQLHQDLTEIEHQIREKIDDLQGRLLDWLAKFDTIVLASVDPSTLVKHGIVDAGGRTLVYTMIWSYIRFKELAQDTIPAAQLHLIDGSRATEECSSCGKSCHEDKCTCSN